MYIFSFQFLLIKNKLFALLFLCTFIAFPIYSQTNQNTKQEIDSLKNVYLYNENDTVKLISLTLIGQRWRYLNIDSAKYYLKKAIYLHKKKKVNLDYLTFSYNILADIYKLEPKLDSARICYKEAYQFLSEHKENKVSLLGIIPTYGNFLVTHDEIDKGVKIFQEGIKIAKESALYEDLGYIYQYLGEAFQIVLKDNDRAKELYNLGLESIKNLKDTNNNEKRIKGKILLNLSSISLEEGDLTTALKYAQEASKYAQAVNMPQLVVEGLNNQCEAHIGMQQYEQANFLIQKATRLNQTIQNGLAGINTQILGQRLLLKTKNYRRCIRNGKEILNTHKNIISDKNKARVYDHLCESYTNLGNKAMSLEMKDSLLRYTNKVLNFEKKELLARLDREYQVKEKEAQNKILEVKQIANESKIKLQQYAVIGLGLLLFALGLVYINIRKKNKLISNDLKNKEIIANQSKLLSEIDNQKSKLLVNVAHDLKTPLSVVQGLVQQLKNNKNTKEDNQKYNAIISNTQQLAEYVNNMLEMSKGDVTQHQFSPSHFDLVKMLQDCIDKFDSSLKEKHLNVESQFEDSILNLYTDAKVLKTIFKNLISNAIRYATPNSTINLNLNKLENGKLKFEIINQGETIPKEDLDNIFNRFYQSSNSKQAGFGIGLSIVKEYATILNSTIEVQSSADSGTQFTLFIPNDEYGEVDPLEQNGNIYYLSPISTQTIKNKTSLRLLIVEDNKDYSLFLKSALQEKFQLEFASNGEDALKKIEINLPDLIISDWMMAKGDGLQLIKALKGDTMFSSIPTILLTARTLLTDQIKAKNAGFDIILKKEVSAEVLISNITILLNKGEDHSPQFEFINTVSQKNQEWLIDFEKSVIGQIQNFDLTTKSLAETLQISIPHLNRKLKTLTGYSTKAYIQEIRFWEARRKLEEQEVQSVKEVCYSVGFKDIRNFSKKFKEKFELYPSDILGR